jgi:type II secretory ATPase GspE/PulE/Tfp pilus assembly ATPase PilB-like protein
VLANSPAVRDAVQHKAGAAEIRALAVSEGLRTLVQDGLDKCLEGLTDLRQVLAVCGE